MTLPPAKKRFPWLRLAVHIIGGLPLAVLLVNLALQRLTVNPIQAAEQSLGRTAAYFLVATLTVTPIGTLTGWRMLGPRRRALGLYTFLYASLHILTFIGLDYGFNFGQILGLIATKPYILVGTLAFLMLLPLAITSFDYFQHLLKRRWKDLHRLIYPAALVVMLHFAWARKGDLLRLQGNILQPLVLAMGVIFLLMLRLPPVRRALTDFRQLMVARWHARRDRRAAPPSPSEDPH